MSNFIQSLLLTNKKTILNTIKKYNLFCKKVKYENQKFKIIYNNFNNSEIPRLIFRNLKFLNLKNNSYKLITYNFNNMIDCDNLNELDEEFIYEYFEGTTIKVLYVPTINKWLYTTNKCLDLKESLFSSTMNHDEQFNETIDKSKLQKYLNPKYNYAHLF